MKKLLVVLILMASQVSSAYVWQVSKLNYSNGYYSLLVRYTSHPGDWPAVYAAGTAKCQTVGQVIDNTKTKVWNLYYYGGGYGAQFTCKRPI